MRRLVTITLGWTLATAGSAGLAVAAVGVVADEVVAPRSPLAIVTAVGVDGPVSVEAPVHATGAVRDLGRPPAELAPPSPVDPLGRADEVGEVVTRPDRGEGDTRPVTASGGAGTAEEASAVRPSTPAGSSGGEGADAEAGTSPASSSTGSSGSSSGSSTVRGGEEEPAPAAAAPPPGSTSGSTSGSPSSAPPDPPAPAEPAGERRTYRLELGTVTVSFAPGDVHVVQYTASCDACTVTVEQRGDDRVRVEFTSDGHTSRLDARWHRDAPDAEVRERSTGKAGKGG
ncbi:MAG: hypothetical protein ACLGIR_02235 [Actinomycetes bacterium]